MASVKESYSCGIGKLHFQSLQCCATILCFTGIYSLSSLTTSTLQVYISSQITTLEKQFGFTSSQSGLLLSCNDAGFLIVILFISYRATRAHIPRALGLSTILFGLAGIFCSFAYFFMPNKNVLASDKNITSVRQISQDFCNHDFNRTLYNDQKCNSEGTKTVGSATAFTPIALVILALGMLLQGIAKSPRMPFVSYYIDENVDKRKTSLYLGVIIAIGIFGPAVAFGLGAVFTNIYVTLDETEITPRDPRWIGAWWLGFLIFGTISIVLALPLFCFPKRFKTKEKGNNPTEDLTFKQHITGFLTTILRLLRNGCYTFDVLGSCLQLFFVAGTISFMPKYLETQFTIPAWHANILMGGLNVCSAVVGTLIGGYVVYKFQMTPYQCIKLSTLLIIITSVSPIFGFFIGCENPEIIGYNAENNYNLTSCIESCNCDTEKFFPVCGSDNKNYFSYCHAGCTGTSKQGYTHCHCIGENATAAPGLCSPDCNMLYVYISLVFTFSLIHTVAIMPDYIFTLRCVAEKDKAMAVAFRTLMQTLLGWFPGPIIIGQVIDTCCRLWNQSCGNTGACALFDIVDFRYKRHGLDLIIKVGTVICFIITFTFARRRPELRKLKSNDIDVELKIEPEGEILIDKSSNLK